MNTAPECGYCHHPAEEPCEEASPGRPYLCTRTFDHSGPHVACAEEEHSLVMWGYPVGHSTGPHVHHAAGSSPEASIADLTIHLMKRHEAESSARCWTSYAKGQEKRAEEAEARIKNLEGSRDTWREWAKERTATIKEQHALIDALRTETPRPLTAREHLDAAWEAAHAPADGAIPAGADYLWRNTASGRIVQGVPDDEAGSVGAGGLTERRLLDPPEPQRPEGAAELEIVIGLNAGEWTGGADDVRALADLLASRGVRAPEADPDDHNLACEGVGNGMPCSDCAYYWAQDREVDQ